MMICVAFCEANNWQYFISKSSEVASSIVVESHLDGWEVGKLT